MYMTPLNETTIISYLNEKVLPHTRLKGSGVEKVGKAGGGLSSLVFRVELSNGDVIFLKQVVEGALGFTEVPKDILILFSEDRQQFEVKAIRVFREAVGAKFAPEVIWFSPEDKILVLSDIAGVDGFILEDKFPEIITVEMSKQLGFIAAKLAKNTFGKAKPIRSDIIDRDIRKLKMKYLFEIAFDKLPGNRQQIEQRIKTFVPIATDITSSVVHGDYHPRNIIVAHNHVAVFDFEESIIWDPVFDIATLLGHYLLRLLHHQEMKDKIIDCIMVLLESFYGDFGIVNGLKEEFRIRNYAAGWMMFRIDGISPAKWIIDEAEKQRIRDFVVKLLFGKHNLISLIKVDL